MPGRRSTVETHPQRDKIVRAIINGEESYRAIAKRFGLSKAAISRYLNERLIQKAAKAATHRDLKAGGALLAYLESILERMQKMYNSLDAWLQDPDNPDQYNINPRATEIMIVYSTKPKGSEKPISRTATLQALIDKIEGAEEDIEVISVKYKVADPRKLFIDTHNAMSRDLELAGKLVGEIKDIQVNATLYLQYVTNVRTLVVKLLRRYPEARNAMVSGLEKLAKKEAPNE